MKVLVFGPSGVGKTYIVKALQQSGINAYDADVVEGLSAWYNQHGEKIPTPTSAHEALTNHYSFLWDKQFLENFLAQFNDVYLFGGSGNTFKIFDLFDKVFFLKEDTQIQKERLLNSRKNSLMDFGAGEMITWGDWLEQESIKRNIPFIDGTLSPKEVFDIINK